MNTLRPFFHLISGTFNNKLACMETQILLAYFILHILIAIAI